MTRLYRRRPRRIVCVGCGAEGETLVLHFQLTRTVFAADGRPSMRGAGAIDLCERCWSTVTRRSAIRRRPARPPG